MLLESIVLAILIGFISGGKLNSLLEVRMKKVGLLILGAFLQAVAYWSVKLNLDFGFNGIIPVLHSFSYLLLLTFTVVNRSFPGISIVSLGIALNALVISLNGGLMPVDPTYLPEASYQLLQSGNGTHGLETEMTRLKFLADIFYSDIPGLGKQLFSLGDVFIDLGIGIFIVKRMRMQKGEVPRNDFSR